MPTVFRRGPYRFYFYSNEADEPMHVHVVGCEFLFKPPSVAEITRDSETSSGSLPSELPAGLRCRFWIISNYDLPVACAGHPCARVV